MAGSILRRRDDYDKSHVPAVEVRVGCVGMRAVDGDEDCDGMLCCLLTCLEGADGSFDATVVPAVVVVVIRHCYFAAVVVVVDRSDRSLWNHRETRLQRSYPSS